MSDPSGDFDERLDRAAAVLAPSAFGDPKLGPAFSDHHRLFCQQMARMKVLRVLAALRGETIAEDNPAGYRPDLLDAPVVLPRVVLDGVRDALLDAEMMGVVEKRLGDVKAAEILGRLLAL
ncbi:MAG: hypothetical protein M0Z28_27495 [Rhodospirillales bacterium]|nr:hypothetical protein [Rhodospirillales bacterium]